MGYAVPAAIGAKLANPDRDVVALAGDGAFLMTGLELITAAAYGAGAVVCLLRDGELAQIAQFQRTALGAAAGAACCRPTTCGRSPQPSARATWPAAATRRDRARADAGRARAVGPVIVDVAIDYSRKTYFTQGVVTTNFWRMPWPERLRLLGRAASRHLERRLGQ